MFLVPIKLVSFDFNYFPKIFVLVPIFFFFLGFDPNIFKNFGFSFYLNMRRWHDYLSSMLSLNEGRLIVGIKTKTFRNVWIKKILKD